MEVLKIVGSGIGAAAKIIVKEEGVGHVVCNYC